MMRMKIEKLSMTLIFTGLISVSNTSWANELQGGGIKTRESNTGFPYSALSSRADSLKINYTTEGNVIRCRVVMTEKSREHRSSDKQILKNRFEVAPLSACLSKTEAFEWLGKTLEQGSVDKR
ncbi:hypothetical protein ACFO4O_00175 [Glaciecola siphonariae]|uniref:Uncharacterized protein n=1 Tax=Glaciecola siphonariae TaxID=521012 RepID=A0ABV9LQX0_9ALTE